MKWYYIVADHGEEQHAGSKARADIEAIARSSGMKAITFSGKQSARGKLIDQVALLMITIRNWFHLLGKLPGNATVLVEYPVFPIKTVYIAWAMMRLIQGVKHIHFVALVHDLNSLRGLYGEAAVFSDHRFLKRFDLIICHNERMKRRLEAMGMNTDRIVSLGMFDYLTDAPLRLRAFSASVIVAGNLERRKCGYLYQWINSPGLEFDLHLYGPCFTGNAVSKRVNYHGEFPADQLPQMMQGAFGLVWDGESTQTCSGAFGDYLRLNNPHKASLYLAAGIPVLIWQEAALAPWITEHGLGIAISSLDEIPEILAGMDEARYRKLNENALAYAQKLRTGQHFLKASDTANRLLPDQSEIEASKEKHRTQKGEKSMKDYRLLAMIPARMGSKRIPKKNIRLMMGKPLIQYPIDLALASGQLEEIWVNTESVALGHACEKMGAKFHPRPAELATDTATNRDFVYQFLKTHECDYVVMINPTSPALRQETLNSFLNFIRENDYDTVFSVIDLQAESYYQGKAINFDGKDKINSQYLEPVQVIMWAITAWKRDTFIALQESGQCPVFGGKVGLFPIPKDESPDLDTEQDWNIAEATLMARQADTEQKKQYMDLD